MACAITSLFLMAMMVGIVAVAVAFGSSAKEKPSARRPSGDHVIA
jgi:hypothetical protein